LFWQFLGEVFSVKKDYEFDTESFAKMNLDRYLSYLMWDFINIINSVDKIIDMELGDFKTDLADPQLIIETNEVRDMLVKIWTDVILNLPISLLSKEVLEEIEKVNDIITGKGDNTLWL